MSANRLGEEKISKLLWEFSFPATVGMLVNAIYNVVDRLFIGHAPHLGQLGLAALTIAFPMMMILMAFAIMIGVGGSTLFSIHMGRGEPRQAERYLGSAVSIMIAVSVVFTVLGLIFIDPLLQLFGADAEVLPLAREYLSVILYGTLFQTVSMGLNNFIRANGSPNIAMVTMFIGAGFNIIFDAVFILGFGWGLSGAAWATIGGQALSAVWCLIYFARSKNTRLRLRHMLPDLRRIGKIFATGFPALIMNIVGSVLNVFLNWQLMAYGGNVAISAMGIVNSLQTFLVMPVIGINQGVQPIISYNFGARKIKRVHTALYQAMGAATVICLIGWVLTRFCPELLASIFTGDGELIEVTGIFVSRWFACLVIIGSQIVGSNYFQAIGKPTVSTFLTMSRQVLLLIPLIYLLPRFWGRDGILLAAPISDAVSFLLVMTWLFVYMRRQKRRFASLPPVEPSADTADATVK
ncbi:MAG: MATE family efflux transporter [Clostridiales bacterium]|nr:MATE family efflux transporter [Clostridiales bacterium]